jgi:hypothetical protein
MLERTLPIRAYEKWSPKEDNLLITAFQAGAARKAIAAELGRTPGAIRSRLVKQGLIDPSLSPAPTTRGRGALAPGSRESGRDLPIETPNDFPDTPRRLTPPAAPQGQSSWLTTIYLIIRSWFRGLRPLAQKRKENLPDVF